MEVETILPAMQRPQETPTRAKSAFVAAFLSLIFPGLGQAYVGTYLRALAWAAPPILALALLGGIGLRMDRLELLGFVLQPWVLQGAFVLNLLALIYRGLAIVDAWRIANLANAYATGSAARLGTPRLRPSPLSLAGLLAILLVMAGAHVAVARYDLSALDLVGCVFDENGTASCDPPSPTPSGSAAPTTSLEPAPSQDAIPSVAASPVGSAVPSPSNLPAWDGKEVLNILLIGSDERPGDSSKRTDTMIVLSIDPATKRVAMFQVPRDTVDVPIPAGPARSLFGRTYAGKINSYFQAVRNRPDLYPGTDKTRGYNGLKAILGELYGLDIRWYVEVNFQGFKQVVDTVGGVTINVQTPVTDDRYPGDDGRLRRIYIPTGVQHMDGEQALIYARSRHDSTDFDRGARQQRILLSLREQTDIASLIPRLDQLVGALKSAVRTDIPPSELPKLLSLAEGVDIRNVRSYVFAPSTFATEVASGDPRGYIIVPKVDRIRTAVARAFTVDPAEEARREAISTEAAQVWVLDGGSAASQVGDAVGYLDYQGFRVSAPKLAIEGKAPSTTRIVAYNGAATAFPTSIAYLESLYDTTVVPVDDPTAVADIVITVTKSTKTPAVPAAP
jgi:LCP family protein required for cell wall assembly